jgi:hypothetical protein
MSAPCLKWTGVRSSFVMILCHRQAVKVFSDGSSGDSSGDSSVVVIDRDDVVRAVIAMRLDFSWIGDAVAFRVVGERVHHDERDGHDGILGSWRSRLTWREGAPDE